MSGPNFSAEDVAEIGLFFLNYAIVAPASGVALVVGLFTFAGARKKRPRFLIPFAIASLLVAGGQLLVGFGESEWWLDALLGVQSAASIAVLVWVWPPNPALART